MTLLGIGLYSAAEGGALVLDLAARGVGHQFSTSEHGFDTFACFVPLNLVDAFYFYDRPGLFEVRATWLGSVVWEGRLEDVTIADGGIQLTAFGHWRALYDAPYTALWSDTSVTNWEQLTTADRAACFNERYQLDNRNRLYIAPREGEEFGTTGTLAGMWGYRIPSGSNSGRQLTYVSFDYEFFAAADWQVGFQRTDSSWGFLTNPWTLAGNGALQTGSVATAITACDNCLFFMLYAAANATYAANTGNHYLSITNLRLTTSGAAIYSDEIARHLIGAVSGVNSTQLASGTGLVQSPSVDLKDETYEDAWPADIIDRLAQIGDASTQLWEAGVWEGRLLTFRQRLAAALTGGVRWWYVDATSLEVNRTLEALRNSAYAVYQDKDGRTLRTAASADADSAARFGLTRREAVQTSTTSASDAGNIRNLTLNDKKNPRPWATLAFRELYDRNGVRWPLFMARAWDRLTIRNLPPTLVVEIDRVRSFRITATNYDVETDTLEVVPEAHQPRVDLLLARLAAGIRAPWEITDRRADRGRGRR